jgi:hypothetical protein
MNRGANETFRCASETVRTSTHICDNVCVEFQMAESPFHLLVGACWHSFDVFFEGLGYHLKSALWARMVLKGLCGRPTSRKSSMFP